MVYLSQSQVEKSVICCYRYQNSRSIHVGKSLISRMDTSVVTEEMTLKYETVSNQERENVSMERGPQKQG